MKTTKRALLTSVMALILCFSMLVGTTFAWFTDEVKSDVNKIVAGNLDVEVYHGDPTLKQSITEEPKLFDDITYWEPGAMAYENLTVVNAGTLALTYRMTLAFEALTSVQGPDGKEYDLTDVLKVAVYEGYFDGTREAVANMNFSESLDSFTLSGELLPGTAGETFAIVLYWAPNSNEIDNIFNMNNGKTTKLEANLGVHVFATQLESEEDSFDHLYDEQADRTINPDETVYIIEEHVNESYDNKGTLVIEDSTLTEDSSYMLINRGSMIIEDSSLANAGYPLYNMGDATLSSVDVDVTSSSGVIYAVHSGAGASTVMDDVNVYSQNGGISANGGAQVVYNSGNIEINSTQTSQRHIFMAVGEGTVVVVNGGDFAFEAYRQRSYACAIDGGTIIITGGNFGVAPNHTRWKHPIYTANGGKVIITGGTFKFDPSEWVAVGYKAVKNGDTWTVVEPTQAEANQALAEAIASGKTTITLGAGDYVIPAAAQGKTLTIVGTGDTNVAVTKVGNGGENCDYGLDGSTVVFENVTITTNSSTYIGYARCNATYNNCTINGTYTLYGDSVFNNCTFNVVGDVYNIWTWGAPTATFNGCTFNSDGKALLLYGQANTKLTVNDCTFNDNGGLTDLKAAIEIGNDYNKSYELIVNNTVVNGYEINDKGICTNSTLWANKNSMGTDKLNVVIDGVDVY